MTRRHWKFHAARFTLGAAITLAVAWLSGLWWPVIAAALTGYAGWLLYNTWHLYRWLASEDREPPESLGVWSEIFSRISRLQRRNREQLQRNQAIIKEFQSMTDAFPDATLVLDEHDGITWFNDAAQRMIGLRTPEDLGQPLTNLLRDPEFANWMAVDGKVESRFEMPSPLDPNVRLSAHSVRHREDQRLLILRDVTDLHNLEQVRRDFVANVSHELRTPLTVLLGYLEAMDDPDDEEMAPAVARMQEQARQMQALLNDLLELSRLQSDNLGDRQSSIDVCAILMQLKEQAEEISQGNHDIDIQCEPGLYLRGSEADIESAFRNLVNNAIHYTPEGGCVTVHWREGDDGGPRLSVRDTGIGIPRRDIPRLTERFYRVGADRSRHTGGTGLGLAIVKHVLNAHDARLLIESELGEGSTFTCLFPPARRSTRNETKENA